MLSRNLPPSELRVVQIGGGTRELYYYPKKTVQVTVIKEDLKTGLMEQAGIQAGVPVVCRDEPATSLMDMGGAAADAVVCLSQLHTIPNLDAFFAAVQRVLKPGGRFIFVQPVKSGGSASPTQSLTGSAQKAVDIEAFESMKQLPGFESVAWDVANQNLDPHVVGLAIKRSQLEGSKSTKARKSR